VGRWAAVHEKEEKRKGGGSRCAASAFLSLLSFPSVSHFSRRFGHQISVSLRWGRKEKGNEERTEKEEEM